jgi:hypothetical protein
MCIGILLRLRDAVRTKHSEKIETQQFVSLSRQCSSTQVGFGQGFLSKNNVTTLEHPPYSPDLAEADFYVFY